ncbi:MAG TPA: CGNR zinc finger domain-containing protein [Pseudonocardia sp.]|jgi:hypothetical protein|nr:CGNR zinc finger domain-containing protein [Pseudonocardia sp.]
MSEFARMTETASGRYGVELAPDGLALVHELLNTFSAGSPRKPDLLSTAELAQSWLEHTVALWAGRAGVERPPAIVLGERDLPEPRALRDQLREQLSDPATHDAEPGPADRTGSLLLTLAADGTLAVHPEGRGARWLTSAVLGELYLGHERDTWRRLKICRNDRCGTAFYDRSRNNSGVWHNVHRCGNAANLRASRARRRSASSGITDRAKPSTV